MVSPANGSRLTSSNTVLLDWDPISGWGEVCEESANHQYKLYVNEVLTATYDTSTTSHSFTGTWGSTYTWRVVTDNGPEDATSPTWSFTFGAAAPVIGRVFEDIDGNGGYSGPTEAWSYNPPPAAGCASFLDNDIQMRSPAGNLTNRLAGWGCNGGGAYYYTTPFTIPGPPTTLTNVQIEFISPDPIIYPSSQVNWSYSRCTVAGTCNATGPITGTNTNIANIQISAVNGDATNHLQWQVKKNRPPTATITAVPTSPLYSGHTMNSALGQPVSIFPVGSTQTLTATARETQASGPWRLQVARRPFDPITRISPTDAASFVVLGTNSACSGLTCTASYNDGSIQPGYFNYYPVSQDDVSVSSGVGHITNQCNGHPGVNSGVVTGWADCDPQWADGYQDEAVVFGDRVPTCGGITGPNYLYAYPLGQPYVYSESVGWFNMRASDLDKTEVKHRWTPNWSNTDGLYPTIRQIRIYAAATLSEGVGPVMQLWLGDNANGGVRGVSPTWQTTVSNVYPAYSAYTINGTFNNVSSIDIGFPNDQNLNGDRNLYIQRIEVTYDVRPGNTLVKTLYPYTVAGNGAVYYDRGDKVAAPYNNNGTWFDGVDFTEVTQAGGSFSGVAAGNMAWSGTMSFPIPIRSSATGNNLSLNATPMGTFPYYDGADCSALAITNDTNPTYTVTGTAYTRDASLQCNAQGVSPDRIENTGVQLRDMSGNPIPGLTSTTDASGNYTISNVPVFYRPDPFCPSCGARACLDQTDPDVGVLISACYQMEPPTAVNSSAWADSALCSPKISTTPQITVGSTATVNLGFDYYQNEKWSTVLDGDVYAPGISFDIAPVPGTNFAPYFINRRIDLGPSATIGGFTFVDDPVVDLGTLTRANLSEYGGYARSLRNAAGTYDFKDKWISNFTLVLPTHSRVVDGYDPRLGFSGQYAFNSQNIYVYDRNGFMNWYSDPSITRYRINGPDNIAIIYVKGDVAGGETLNLNRAVRTTDINEMLVLVTNLPVIIDDTVDIDEGLLTGAGFNVNSLGAESAPNQLSEGYLDFVILSSADIEFDSRYDDTVDPTIYDLPIALYGSLISKDSVSLNRDLWHIYNSDYPSEMVRYYPRLLPELLKIETQDPAIPSFTGLGVFDIQTVYE
ncbi:hypothetical protein GYA27_04025 [candidate division WWE3 bacterium]|uniref:Uncharacterized protein n=1 Tax=candidate division WWE3 bacterium TaxID=2053526 RepID=A0A7X9HGW9_UNCKA|nr:hypothetical protein [candidate division WWE3 bacterium]